MAYSDTDNKYDFKKYRPLLKQFLTAHGVNVNKNPTKCFHPSHENRNEDALSIYQDTKTGDWVFQCMNPACGIRGDIYDAASVLHDIPANGRGEQFRFIRNYFGDSPIIEKSKPKPPVKRDALAEMSIEKFMQDHPERKEGVLKYLVQRGYSEEQTRMLEPYFWYWPGIDEGLKAFGKQKLKAAKIPLFHPETGKSTWEKSGPVLPLGFGWKMFYFDESGNSQKMESKSGSQFSKEINPFKGLNQVVFVEGEIDSKVCKIIGIENVFPLGTASISGYVCDYLAESNVPNIILLMDGDEPGRIASGTDFLPSTGEQSAYCIPKKILKSGYIGEILVTELPEGEDPDSLWKKGRQDEIFQAINNARNFNDIKPPHRIVNDPGESGFPFRMLGVQDNTHYFISRSKEVFAISCGNMNRSHFLNLASLSFWETVKVNKSGTPDWEYINDLILDYSVQQGAYNPANIRGSGIWEDAGEIVYSDGKNVYSESRGTHIVSEFPSHNYIYVQSNGFGLQSIENKRDEEDREFIKWMVSRISFKTDEHGKLLLGWAITSLFLSIIKWRPIGYMKGPTSVGKSWTMNHVVRPLLGDICICPTKSSTAKGIMQAPRHDSRMTTIDELESSGEKKIQEVIKELMTIARDVTTKSKEKRYIGSSDQQGDSRQIVSMFLFASIVESANEDQDVNRITSFEFATRKTPETWNEIESRIDYEFSNGLGERIRADVIYWRENVVKNIKTFQKVASERTKKQRNADQLGTLIAGWSYFECGGQRVYTEEEAADLIAKFDFSAQEQRSEGRMMKTILGSILSYKIRYEEEEESVTKEYDTDGKVIVRIKQRNRSVYDILRDLSQIKEDTTRHFLNRELQPFGIRFGTKKNPNKLVIACNHEAIKKMLPDDFAYKMNYRDYLKDHPHMICEEKSVRFSGVVYSALVFDVNFSEDEYDDEIPF